MLLDNLEELTVRDKRFDAYKAPETQITLERIPKVYKRPRKSIFFRMLHPFELVGLDRYHLYIRDAQELMKMGKFVDAAGAYNKASEQKPKSLEAYFGVVECLQALGGESNLALGLKYLKKALLIDYRNLRIYDEIIYINEVLKNKQEALEYHHRRFALRSFLNDKKSAMMQNNLGVMLMKIGLFKESTKYFQKALIADATFFKARMNLAKAWFGWALEVKKPKLKKLYLNNSSAELARIYAEDDAPTLLLKGKIELHLGNYEEAKKYLELAYRDSPSMREIYATLQIVNERMGNIKEAIDNHDLFNKLR